MRCLSYGFYEESKIQNRRYLDIMADDFNKYYTSFLIYTTEKKDTFSFKII